MGIHEELAAGHLMLKPTPSAWKVYKHIIDHPTSPGTPLEVVVFDINMANLHMGCIFEQEDGKAIGRAFLSESGGLQVADGVDLHLLKDPREL